MDEKYKIFVGGLSPITTTESLRAHFEGYGELSDQVVMTDPGSGKSRCFGFVTYKEEEPFERCLSETHTLDGKMVDIKKAVPKENNRNGMASQEVGGKGNKLFLGGLSRDTNEDDIRAAIGYNLESVDLKYKEDGYSRGFGFIVFSNPADLEEMWKKGNRIKIKDRDVEIKLALPKYAMQGGGGQGSFGRGGSRGGFGRGRGGRGGFGGNRGGFGQRGGYQGGRGGGYQGNGGYQGGGGYQQSGYQQQATGGGYQQGYQQGGGAYQQGGGAYQQSSGYQQGGGASYQAGGGAYQAAAPAAGGGYYSSDQQQVAGYPAGSYSQPSSGYSGYQQQQQQQQQPAYSQGYGTAVYGGATAYSQQPPAAPTQAAAAAVAAPPVAGTYGQVPSSFGPTRGGGKQAREFHPYSQGR